MIHVPISFDAVGIVLVTCLIHQRSTVSKSHSL